MHSGFAEIWPPSEQQRETVQNATCKRRSELSQNAGCACVTKLTHCHDSVSVAEISVGPRFIAAPTSVEVVEPTRTSVLARHAGGLLAAYSRALGDTWFSVHG